MKIVIRAYAGAAEALGFREKHIEVEYNSTARDLVVALAGTHKNFERMSGTILTAINEEYCPLDTVVKEDDIVDLIPPVGGG